MTTLTEPSEPSLETTSAPGDRFVAVTLLALALVLGIYQLVTAPFIPVLTVFMLVYAAVGAALWRVRPRWLLVVAGLLATAYLVGAFPVFVEHLAHPESPVGFITDVVLLAGLVTVILGVIGGLRGASPSSRYPIAIAAGGLATLASIASVVAAMAVDGDVRQPDDLTVEVVDWVFPDLTIPASDTVLWVDNRDPFHHTFVVEGTDVHEVLPASTAVRIPLDLPPGTYLYLCDVPGHEDMRGELEIR
jgi:plastocyanin